MAANRSIPFSTGLLSFLVEFRLEVRWDQEHTLGVLVRDGTLVELNGSVIR